MSKASEWANAVRCAKPAQFSATELRGLVTVLGLVEPHELRCVIVSSAPESQITLGMEAATALKLARWILDTFGEDEKR